jgi:hypothetical protein
VRLGIAVTQPGHVGPIGATSGAGLISRPHIARTVPWHNFVIHEPTDGQTTYVTTETVHGELAVREPADVAIYLKSWDGLRRSAVVGDDAAQWIRKLP